MMKFVLSSLATLALLLTPQWCSAGESFGSDSSESSDDTHSAAPVYVRFGSQVKLAPQAYPEHRLHSHNDPWPSLSEIDSHVQEDEEGKQKAPEPQSVTAFSSDTPEKIADRIHDGL